MRRIALIAIAFACALALAVPAQGASTFTIRGAGYGHGIGMSQYGAYGFAQHGTGYREILRHYYRGTQLGQAPSGTVVRVLLQSGRSPSFTGATRAGKRRLRPDRVYRV